MSFKVLINSFVLFLGVIFFTHSAYAFSGTGAGTSGDPYKITTCAQLMEMSNALTSYYIQTKNIDCNGVTFTPIATGTYFEGTFDGQNYTISNLTISGGQYTGMFGHTRNALIQNVRIISGSISGTTDSGSLIADARTNTTVLHSSSQADMTGTVACGGLIGHSASNLRVEKSFYNGTLNFTGTSSCGGLVGVIDGSGNTVKDSYTSGTFDFSSSNENGAVIGSLGASSDYSNIYSTAIINVNGAANIGGLIGSTTFAGTLTNSFSAATMTGSDSNRGGVFGFFLVSASSDIYFDNTLAGTSNCAGTGGSPTCTAKATSWFVGNKTNAPMSAWDFDSIWQVNAGGYPTLRGFVEPANPVSGNTSSPLAPLSTNTTSTPTCNDSTPINSPDLFQVDTTASTATLHFAPASNANNYFISFGFTPGDNRFGDEFSENNLSGALTRTINFLSPNTTYYIRVRGGNGCMPGNWSNELKIKTSSNVTALQKYFAH